MFKTLFILALALSPSLLAHPGHDHHSPQANFIHIEFIVASTVLLLGLAYFFSTKHRNKLSSK